ncbi:MAG: 4-hydroxy-tetrahydrodipicolinate synthase [Kiritimatiellia bacterium]|nr:4-hydroxy-tetrahydrodipicolinate synthase [Kiritimatiellia bacterium]
MFEGAYTAIATPFTADGHIDHPTLRKLIEFQIAHGMSGIVPAGTTGESPTLTVEEHIHLIEECVTCVKGRIKVIAGTGGNSTEEALELTRHAKSAGADATLQVTPYYNKPTQTGLIRHFSAIADVGLPVILYHVPGRSACSIDVDTAVELSRHPGIVAIKEAGGEVDRTSHIVRRCALTVLSGDDALTLPMMAVGARGVISVASNVVPQSVSDLVRAALAGRWDEARKIHLSLHELFGHLFLETNPIPVKAAMALRGLLQEQYRLPLCEMNPAKRQILARTLSLAPAV